MNQQKNYFFNSNNITGYLYLILIMIASGYVYFLTEYSINRLGIQQINNFIVIFLSILIEAIPFIIIGVILASLIEVFVSEQKISSLIPQSTFLGLIIASLIGLIFPACECGIIPIARKLIKKGVPTHIAITFMLAVPIVNPIVIISTIIAFPGNYIYVVLRVFLGIFVAILVGYSIYMLFNNSTILNARISGDDHAHHQDYHPVSCCQEYHNRNLRFLDKLRKVLEHAAEEFFSVGKYLIMGSFLASLIQIFISRSFILSIGNGRLSSIIVLMAFAFLISICSEADAFIAATFVNTFSLSSIIAFMVLGPMLDVKNLLLMLASFKKKFVFTLVILIILFVFMVAIQLNIFTGGGKWTLSF